MKSQTFISLWLRLAGLLILFSLALLQVALSVAQAMEKRVIAYAQEDSFDSRHIYLMDIDTGFNRKLNDLEISDCCLAWSPDGNRLAFPVSGKENTSRIYLMDADGKNLRPLNPLDMRQYEYWPVWSPDGTQIAFTVAENRSDFTTNQLYLIDADGNHLTSLLDGKHGYSMPSFSPAGDRIVFSALTDRDRTYIYTMDIQRKQLVQLTDGGIESDPKWSPNGEQIVYQSFFIGIQGWDVSIWVMNTDGSSKKQLTSLLDDDFSPAWTPDGTHILFTSRKNGFSAIYAMNADGSNRRQLTVGHLNQQYPIWQP